MTEAAHPLAVVIAAAGLLYKLWELRRDPSNPALRAICGVLAGLTGAVLVGWEPAYVRLDSVTGIPNLAKFVEHALALTAAAAVQALFLHLADPASARRRGWIRWALLGAVLIIMAIAFWRASLETEAPNDFADRYADEPNVAWYMLAYLAYLALSMSDILRMSTRYARHASRRLLRLGIRLLAVGSGIGLAYVVHKAAFIVAGRFGADLPWDESSGSRPLILSGIAFVTVGLVLPSVGNAAVSLARWPRQYRLYRRMHPLWLAVYQVAPQIALYEPADPTRDRLIIRSLGHALYRRVIEIHDGVLQVRPLADPAAVAAARRRATAGGLAAPDVEAMAEATAISTGILAYKVRATGASGTKPVATATPTGNAADPEGAARWLARVADFYVNSPSAGEGPERTLDECVTTEGG